MPLGTGRCRIAIELCDEIMLQVDLGLRSHHVRSGQSMLLLLPLLRSQGRPCAVREPAFDRRCLRSNPEPLIAALMHAECSVLPCGRL